jgi:hypothetical protein
LLTRPSLRKIISLQLFQILRPTCSPSPPWRRSGSTRPSSSPSSPSPSGAGYYHWTRTESSSASFFLLPTSLALH